MDGTLKLGLMVTATYVVLWAFAWTTAQVVIHFTKDGE